jgi:hypothetical protein
MKPHPALLLNASNMETYPVYPYAFIQVPAVARQAGVQVVCKDLLGIPQQEWDATLQALVNRNNPEMFLITLRNTDSITLKDYQPAGSGQAGGIDYFPIERTRALIACLRGISNRKIVVGGFGFSLLAEDLMGYLRPDLGVFGGAKAFFSHYADILKGNYAGIANLLYFQDGRLIVNPQTFEPPFPGREYTPQAVDEMMAFYAAFPSPGFEGAPIEVMRGCNHACVFCAEPHVEGWQVQYRDISAVIADIQILVDQGVTRMYMVSSELNPEGNGFMLQLADRIQAFNAGQPARRRIAWYGANYLLSLEPEDYERLYQSGFTGGWFDITALDDPNARLMRTPYRNVTLLRHLKTYAQYRKKQPPFRPEASQANSQNGEQGERSEATRVDWSMFLGNLATSLETIRNTLRIADQEGIARIFQSCYLNRYVRIYDYENPDADTLAATFSITPDFQRIPYQQILPSFAYPPALLRHFGSEAAIEAMFDHIAETYLSTKYQQTRDWGAFLRQRATPEAIGRWTAALADMAGLNKLALPGEIPGEDPAVLTQLFSEESQDEASDTHQILAKQVVESLLATGLRAFTNYWEALGLPATPEQLENTTPYALAVAVYSRWDSETALWEALEMQTGEPPGEPLKGFPRFCAQAMLYRFNVRVLAEYKKLFV